MRNLAETRQEEETAQEEYDKTTQENKITTSTLEQEVKTQEFKRLDKRLSRLWHVFPLWGSSTCFMVILYS